MEELYRLAYEAFTKPVPKMAGLDELLAWLDAHHIPMAVASSSPMTIIEGHLDHWVYSTPESPKRIETDFAAAACNPA